MLIEAAFYLTATSVCCTTVTTVLLLHLHNPSDLLKICQICVSLRLNWVICSHWDKEAVKTTAYIFNIFFLLEIIGLQKKNKKIVNLLNSLHWHCHLLIEKHRGWKWWIEALVDLDIYIECVTAWATTHAVQRLNCSEACL